MAHLYRNLLAITLGFGAVLWFSACQSPNAGSDKRHTTDVVSVVYASGPAIRDGVELPKRFEMPLGLVCTAPTTMVLGSPIQIRVTITNHGDQQYGLRGFNDATTSLLRVYRDGHLVEKTSLGLKSLIEEERFPWRLIESEGSSPGNDLPPQHSYSYDLIISDYYQIDRPGNYLVTVKRRQHDTAKDAFAELVDGAVFKVVSPNNAK